MSLFEFLGTVVGETVNLGANVIKTGVRAVTLDAEGTIDQIGTTVEETTDGVGNIIDSIFD